MLHPHRKLTSQWNVCAQPVISKEEPSPDQHAHVDREEDVREKGIADAHMGCDCAAKIACQQDRTKNGGYAESRRRQYKPTRGCRFPERRSQDIQDDGMPPGQVAPSSI